MKHLCYLLASALFSSIACAQTNVSKNDIVSGTGTIEITKTAISFQDYHPSLYAHKEEIVIGEAKTMTGNTEVILTGIVQPYDPSIKTTVKKTESDEAAEAIKKEKSISEIKTAYKLK